MWISVLWAGGWPQLWQVCKACLCNHSAASAFSVLCVAVQLVCSWIAQLCASCKAALAADSKVHWQLTCACCGFACHVDHILQLQYKQCSYSETDLLLPKPLCWCLCRMCRLITLDRVNEETCPDPGKSPSSTLPLSGHLLGRPTALQACHAALMPFLQQPMYSAPDVPVAALAAALRGKEEHHNMLPAPLRQHVAGESTKPRHRDDLHQHVTDCQVTTAAQRARSPNRSPGRGKCPMQEEAGCDLGGGPVPGGYIVPGVPVDADVDVAVQLQLPLLGPSPQLARVFSTRIGCRWGGYGLTAFSQQYPAVHPAIGFVRSQRSCYKLSSRISTNAQQHPRQHVQRTAKASSFQCLQVNKKGQ